MQRNQRIRGGQRNGAKTRISAEARRPITPVGLVPGSIQVVRAPSVRVNTRSVKERTSSICVCCVIGWAFGKFGLRKRVWKRVGSVTIGSQGLQFVIQLHAWQACDAVSRVTEIDWRKSGHQDPYCHQTE